MGHEFHFRGMSDPGTLYGRVHVHIVGFGESKLSRHLQHVRSDESGSLLPKAISEVRYRCMIESPLRFVVATEDPSWNIEPKHFLRPPIGPTIGRLQDIGSQMRPQIQI